MNKSRIELCEQTEIRGWTNAPVLSVYASGEKLGEAFPGDIREDVVEAGVPEGRNFRYRFPRTLWLNDRVVLRQPDDTFLTPAEAFSFLPRLRQLTSCLDLGKPGLEIGPLNRPTIPKERAPVFYVDHAARPDLVRSYGATLADDTDWIVEVDFVWEEGRTLAEVTGGVRYAWVLASHVGEHVGDFVGWLQQIHDVLQPDGVVSLALPHGERTFDRLRPVSSFEDLAGAHLMGLTRPSAHQVLRHMLGVSLFHGIDLSRPENEPGLRNAVAVARSAEAGVYVDVHCHVFTPDSFMTCYRLLRATGLLRLRLLSLCELGRDEFFAVLGRA